MLSKLLKVENPASRENKYEGERRPALPSCARFDFCFYFSSCTLTLGRHLSVPVKSTAPSLTRRLCSVPDYPVIKLSQSPVSTSPTAVIKSVIEKMKQYIAEHTHARSPLASNVPVY